MKSHVTILVCPWCKEEKNVLALDRRLRERFEMHTNDVEPCEKCLKKAVLMFDRDTKEFLGYAKKENVLSEEGLKKHKNTPVKVLAKLNNDGTISLF